MYYEGLVRCKVEELMRNALRVSGIGLLIGGRWENSELTLSDWGLEKMTVKVCGFEVS